MHYDTHSFNYKEQDADCFYPSSHTVGNKKPRKFSKHLTHNNEVKFIPSHSYINLNKHKHRSSYLPQVHYGGVHSFEKSTAVVSTNPTRSVYEAGGRDMQSVCTFRAD